MVVLDSIPKCRQGALFRHMGLLAAGIIGVKQPALMGDNYWHNHEIVRDKTRWRDVMDLSLDGVKAYQAHSYRRAVDVDVVWQQGETSLLYYPASGRGRQKRQRIFIVPSMINDETILDILPDGRGPSFIRFLTRQGFDVYCVRWGALSKDADLLSVDRAVDSKLAAIMQWFNRESAEPVHAVGYCMGGLLLLALALRFQPAFKTVTFIATPWDFHANGFSSRGARGGKGLFFSRHIIEHMKNDGVLSAEWLQSLFSGLDPAYIVQKFAAFKRMKPLSRQAKLFVAVEDWLASGVDLPADIARVCFGDWFTENTTMKGGWQVHGRVVDPVELRVPSLVIVARRDKLIPPASTEILTQMLPDAYVLKPDCGHISMMVGAQAQAMMWRPHVEWLLQRSKT